MCISEKQANEMTSLKSLKQLNETDCQQRHQISKSSTVEMTIANFSVKIYRLGSGIGQIQARFLVW